MNDYLQTLKSGIEITQIDGRHVISLPFVSWSGHLLEIHVRELQGGYIGLSDIENEIADLWLSGMEISGRYRNIVQGIVNQYNLKLEGDEIIARVPLSKAGETVHRLVQALIRIGDLSFFHRITPIKETPLKKRTRQFLQRSKLKFITGPRATLKGEISKGYELDFLVFNERTSAIKTIEARRGLRIQVEAFAFEFEDIKNANPQTDRIGIYDEDNDLWNEDLLRIARAKTEVILPIQKKDEILSKLR